MRQKLDYYLKLAFENKESRAYHIVNDILAIIIVIAVLIVIVESVVEIQETYTAFFIISEAVVLTIFTLEYLIYIYLAPNKRKYIFSTLGIIDLLAILPTYLGFVLVLAPGFKSLRVLRIVRVLRLLRIFRLLKLVSYARRQHNGEKIHIKDFPWYNIEIYFLALFSVVVIAGTFMHFVEKGIDGTPFINIPQGLWWAIVTLTTVGYGDMVPQTLFGRIIAALTMISGLMLFAVLVSVVGKVMQKILFGTTSEITENNEAPKP